MTKLNVLEKPRVFIIVLNYYELHKTQKFSETNFLFSCITALGMDNSSKENLFDFKHFRLRVQFLWKTQSLQYNISTNKVDYVHSCIAF